MYVCAILGIYNFLTVRDDLVASLALDMAAELSVHLHALSAN